MPVNHFDVYLLNKLNNLVHSQNIGFELSVVQEQKWKKKLLLKINHLN